MQVKFDLKIFIFLLFFFISGQIKIYLLLMLFAAFHECGHMIAGIFLGLKIQKLEIMPVGLKVEFKIDMVNYNKKVLKSNLLTVKKLLIALAGPMVNLIYISFFIMLNKKEVLGIETDTLIYVNILIFLFNMFVIYPLDGGRILKYILHIFFGKITALKITNIIANILTGIITLASIYYSVIFKNFSYFFVIIYILIIVMKENKIYNMKIKMYKILENYIAINQN